MNFSQQPSGPEVQKPKQEQRLDKSLFDDLLKIMRPDSMGPIIGKLPENIEGQYEYIINQLKDGGLYREGLKQRVISNQFKQRAIMTGNDRSFSSEIRYNGGYDGEELAMKEQSVNITDTTYVSDFSKASCRVNKGSVILIYYGEALVPLQSSQNQSGSYSNGFSMFIHPRLKQKSLIAVFEN